MVVHSIQSHFGTSIIKHDLAERSQSGPMAYPEHSDMYIKTKSKLNSLASSTKLRYWCKLIKFIYSEKATSFREISTVDLSYVVMVKSTVEISQKFVAFSGYMNFKRCFADNQIEMILINYSWPLSLSTSIFGSEQNKNMTVYVLGIWPFCAWLIQWTSRKVIDWDSWIWAGFGQGCYVRF